MTFWSLLATAIADKIADRLGDAVVEILRKKSRIDKIGSEGRDLKEELNSAESDAEREAVLDKIHDLVNGFNDV